MPFKVVLCFPILVNDVMTLGLVPMIIQYGSHIDFYYGLRSGWCGGMVLLCFSEFGVLRRKQAVVPRIPCQKQTNSNIDWDDLWIVPWWTCLSTC
jgi:hypothetical protein